MVERTITHTKKDNYGNILAICSPGEWWSPKSTVEAIMEIEELLYEYYVNVASQKVEIKVIKGASGKYLRTDPDKTTKNNLDDLPDC